MLLFALVVSGCNNAKSPDSVAADVAKARQKAVDAVAEVQNDALHDDAKMEAKLDDKSADLANTEARGNYDVAMQKAEGAHDISLQKCNALDGDAQKKCKNQADADYDTAKASAKSVEVSQTQ